VVIDRVQDLDVGAVEERQMGGVGLPALVRHLSLEPHEGAPRTLLGLRDDEAPAREDSPDRRGSRRTTVAPPEVDRDRMGSGIEPLVGELLPELHDLVLERLRDPVRARPGASRPRLEPGLTFGLEPPDELVDPPPRDAVVPSDLRLGPSLDHDRCDDQTCQRHRQPP
jgi:hypothetical protein